MKFSEAWLREFVKTDISREQLLSRLTMAGLEVDGVEPVANLTGPFTVGRVSTLSPHPDADRLRLCTIDVGQAEKLEIVCGAPNVVQGATVVVACQGAVTAQGLKIKPSKIRGQASNGMLVSEEELGLSDQSDGILLLDNELAPGTDFLQWLGLNDVSIEVDLTPNRGDCLSLRGIAREVAALTQAPLNMPSYSDWSVSHEKVIPVTVKDPAACPLYLGCLIENVDPAAATPLWMKERLRRSGLRPISALVDITNYVLIELGQPLHAFDAKRIDGEIQVRWAQPEESLELLDEKQLTLSEKDLVIADKRGALALAGVMGGASSAVSEHSTHVFLECAFFNPLSVMGRARAYGLSTDASHRFERGVDPALQRLALRRAVSLILQIAGGQAGPEVVVEQRSALPVREAIGLEAQSIESILDLTLPTDDVEAKLHALGCEVSAVANGWSVKPPSHRFDLTIEEDLVEELARLVGYDQLPASLPIIESRPILPSESQVSPSQVKRALAGAGFQEVITYSFVPEQLQALLDPEVPPLKLKNPISSDMSVMRTTLWPGLVRAALYNHNRRQRSIRLFEVGQVFHGQLPEHDQASLAATSLLQPVHIGGVWVGDAVSEHWLEPQRLVDFYDLKGSVETFLSRCGHSDITFIACQHASLHPGQSAAIKIKGIAAGWAGRLHPSVEKALGFESAVYVFELTLNEVASVQVPKFKPLSRFPAVRRDLAIIVEEKLCASAVHQQIVSACGELLVDAVVFDVFRGGSVPEGYKSLAVSIILQSQDSTLSEQLVNDCMTRSVEKLTAELGAQLRD